MTANSAPLGRYRTMRRIRSFEERVGELFLRGESAGSMLHLSIGEEAVAGVTDAMREGDAFTTHHRGHGIALGRGADPKRMMAEIAGRASGTCRGKGGSMHIADRALGHLGANAIVGGGIPHVVGAGIAFRNRGEGGVAVAFFGDGAMGQGVLYEAMNLAALWRLPVAFVCVNNRWGMGTRVDRANALAEFPGRAEAFGLRAARAPGEDVEAVYAAAQDILGAARDGRPGFLEVDAFRFHGHARMDKSPYRSPEEEAEGRARDPLAHARSRIVSEGLAEAPDLDGIDREAGEEMDRALAFAGAAPPPGPGTLFEDVYAPGEPPPRPQRDRLRAILGEPA